MEHVLSLSYGKDSLACLGAIEKLGLPLDRIIHAEVWATKEISADLPPMLEFKAKADEIIKSRYGIIVEHVSANVTYNDCFYRKTKEDLEFKASSHIYGFPCIKGAWCNSLLKVNVLQRLSKLGITYIGIASDEPRRFKVLNDKKVSPLVLAEMTEQDCTKWCKENNLLSPIYTSSQRGGCWFCHNQGIDQLRLLRKHYPHLWQMLLQWDKDSPIKFKPKNTVADFEERFQLEDEGILLPNDNCFRWDWLKSEGIQMKFFV